MSQPRSVEELPGQGCHQTVIYHFGDGTSVCPAGPAQALDFNSGDFADHVGYEPRQLEPGTEGLQYQQARHYDPTPGCWVCGEPDLEQEQAP